MVLTSRACALIIGEKREDQRLLTLEDSVEFFNLILGDKLSSPEKQDMVAFLRAL